MRMVLVLLLMLAAVIFAVQNASMVTITVFFWRLEASLAIVIALCVTLGAIGGALLALPHVYRMHAHERRLRAQLADLGVEDTHELSAPPRAPYPSPGPTPNERVIESTNARNTAQPKLYAGSSGYAAGRK